VLSKHIGIPTPEDCNEPLLAYAVVANDLKLTRLLLDAGADPNTVCQAPAEPKFLEYVPASFMKHYLTEEQGMTILMVAAGMGNIDMVKLLLERGAERAKPTLSKYKAGASLLCVVGRTRGLHPGIDRECSVTRTDATRSEPRDPESDALSGWRTHLRHRD
jgi:hypothetical protein